MAWFSNRASCLFDDHDCEMTIELLWPVRQLWFACDGVILSASCLVNGHDFRNIWPVRRVILLLLLFVWYWYCLDMTNSDWRVNDNMWLLGNSWPARYVICRLLMCGMKFACCYDATAEFRLELRTLFSNFVITLWHNESLFGQWDLRPVY